MNEWVLDLFSIREILFKTCTWREFPRTAKKSANGFSQFILQIYALRKSAQSCLQLASLAQSYSFWLHFSYEWMSLYTMYFLHSSSGQHFVVFSFLVMTLNVSRIEPDRQSNRHRQAGRQTDRQTDRQKDRRKDRETDKQRNRQTDRQADWHTDR